MTLADDCIFFEKFKTILLGYHNDEIIINNTPFLS